MTSGSYTTIGSIGSTRRFKYAMVRKTLDHIIEDLKSWQDEFDPSWYLILKVGGHTVDQVFQQAPQRADTLMKTASGIRDTLKDHPQENISVLLPNHQMEDARIEGIALSSARLMQRAGSNRWLILDSVPCDSSKEFHQRTKTIRDLAKKLTKTDPYTFSLLNCIGFVAEKATSQFQLVLKIPTNMSKPQSLRSSLVVGSFEHSLSDRFQIALQLARAVCSVHTFGLVHKSIRPENILLFQDQTSTLGSAFLVGFENVRLEEGQTRLRSDADWEKNIYRHPQRQGVQAQDPYIMQHDIYSLGVCLLEIGLWDSFVLYANNLPDPAASKGYSFYEQSASEGQDSTTVKEQLLVLAKEPLRRSMGNNYARIVETCITCLDEGNEDFGDESEFQDADGVLVAIRYIETILLQLSNISV